MVKKHFYNPTVHSNLLAFIALERKALHHGFFIETWRLILYVNLKKKVVMILYHSKSKFFTYLKHYFYRKKEKAFLFF